MENIKMKIRILSILPIMMMSQATLGSGRQAIIGDKPDDLSAPVFGEIAKDCDQLRKNYVHKNEQIGSIEGVSFQMSQNLCNKDILNDKTFMEECLLTFSKVLEEDENKCANSPIIEKEIRDAVTAIHDNNDVKKKLHSSKCKKLLKPCTLNVKDHRK